MLQKTNSKALTSSSGEPQGGKNYSPTYITRLETRVNKAKELLQNYRGYCTQLRGQLREVEGERTELEIYVSKQSEQLRSLLQNCQELKEEKEKLDCRYRDLHLMNKAMFQVFSESIDHDDSTPRLGLEQLLVKQAEQQGEIEYLQNRVQYQEAQVRTAMCVLQNVHRAGSDSGDEASSDTDTVYSPECSCSESRETTDGL